MANSGANSAIIYDSTSDAGESDASTCDDANNSLVRQTSLARVRSLQQENTVLKLEVDTLKLRCKNLKEENEELRRARVNLQARAEQEEEYISNTLFRKIQSLKKEKEVLAMTYEQEEEFLTNDLGRKLAKLREEKMQLENTLEVEQQNQIAKLLKRIEKLEHETSRKQTALEQLRKDKVDLENYLEQEQEQLVNKLWKQMDELQKQKNDLTVQLEAQNSKVISVEEQKTDETKESSTESDSTKDSSGSEDVSALTEKVDELRLEVNRLKKQLKLCEIEHARKLEEVSKEEIALRAEKLLLERKLAREKERSDALNKQLSESESSLEIDDERHFNESRKSASSPIPVVPGSPMHHRSISGGLNIQVGSPGAMAPGAKCPMRGILTPITPGGTVPNVLSSSVGTSSHHTPVLGGNAMFQSANSHHLHHHVPTPTNFPQPNSGGVGGGVAQSSPAQHSSPYFFSAASPNNVVSPNSVFSNNSSIASGFANVNTQRTRLISGSGSSTTSQRSPRGSLNNDSVTGP